MVNLFFIGGLKYNLALYQAYGMLPKREEPDNHSSPRRLAGEKEFASYNHKTTIWVSHEYYLNPEFHKILWRAF